MVVHSDISCKECSRNMHEDDKHIRYGHILKKVIRMVLKGIGILARLESAPSALHWIRCIVAILYKPHYGILSFFYLYSRIVAFYHSALC